MGLSVKKIRRFIEEDKDKNLSKYLLRFLPTNYFDKKGLDEYVAELMKAKTISKKEIMKRLEDMR